MHPMLNIAIRAARAGGSVIVRHVDRVDTVTITEKAHNDFVSEVDHQAERVIVDTIRRSYPDHAILAEEGGSSGGGEFQWIIDPLDGTTNFLHGFPHFAVSVALKVRGQLDQGVIFDPLRQELFTASRGSGAQLDGKRIRVTRRKHLAGSLLGTGFPFRELANLDAFLQTMAALVPRTAGIRRAGSAALDLAYVAAGRLDGFWEFGLAPWDFAAGALLVREAGGMVSDTLGGENFMDSGDILAGSPRVHHEMLPHLRQAALKVQSQRIAPAQTGV
jgi:myo-inositol-1(or 4)-monophosphatase